MTLVLSTSEKNEIKFLETEIWQNLRPIFIFGRIFGTSYISEIKFNRICLKIYCGFGGIFLFFLFCRSLIFFKDGISNLTAEVVFKIIFLCSIMFGVTCWGSAIHFQHCLNDLASILEPLRANGYKNMNFVGKKSENRKTFFAFLDYFQ